MSIAEWVVSVILGPVTSVIVRTGMVWVTSVVVGPESQNYNLARVSEWKI